MRRRTTTRLMPSIDGLTAGCLSISMRPASRKVAIAELLTWPNWSVSMLRSFSSVQKRNLSRRGARWSPSPRGGVESGEKPGSPTLSRSGAASLRRAGMTGRLLLDPIIDLLGHGLVHLLEDVPDEAYGAGRHGEAAADAPGQSQLGSDGRHGAGHVDGKIAPRLPRRLRADPRHQRDISAGESRLRRDLEQGRRARIEGLVKRMADAGDDLPSRAERRHDLPRDGVEIGPLAVRQRLLKHARRVVERSGEDGAEAEESGRHRTLDRFRRAAIGQPRRKGGGRDPVLHEDDHHRVEDARLRLLRQATEDLEKGHLAEIDLADNLLAEIETVHHDLRRCRPGDVRFDVLALHGALEMFPASGIRDSALARSSCFTILLPFGPLIRGKSSTKTMRRGTL